MLINVRDYATVQDALDAAEDGDRVYFPSLPPNLSSGTPASYQPPSAAGWSITKRLEIFGDGVGTDASSFGTTFIPYGSVTDLNATKDSKIFVIVTPNAYVYMHDFKIFRSQAPAQKYWGTAGHGISCITGTGANEKGTCLRFERITISGMGSDGLRLVGNFTSGDHAINFVAIRDCVFNVGGMDGLHLENVYNVMIDSCAMGSNQMRGIYAFQSEVKIANCILFGNCLSTETNPVLPRYLLPNYDGNVRLTSCPIANVDTTHFENYNLSTVKRGIVFEDCAGGGIASCFFVNSSDVDGTDLGIYIDGSGQGPVNVMSNRFTNASNLVNIATGANACTIMPQYVVTPGHAGAFAMTLPASPNGGLFGVPSIVRLGTPKSANVTGLVIPSGDALPTANLQYGMLCYRTGATAPGLYVYTTVSGSAQWKLVLAAT